MIGRIIALLVLAAMAGLVYWQFRAQYAVLEEHDQRQPDAAAARAAQPQLDCAQAAAARFRNLGLATHAGASHRARFNAALNQCYQWIEDRRTAMGTEWRNITLYDGRGRVFASFGWHSVDGRPRENTSPYSCNVTLPSGEHRDCGSEAEFKQLTAVYMH